MSNNNTYIKGKEEMNLKQLTDIIWQNRSILIKWGFSTFLVGLFLVIFTPRKYTTEVHLLAESSASSSANGLMGQLSGISGLDVGSLIGMDLGSGGNAALTPDLYPDVVKSTTFLMDILNENVYIPREKKEVSVSEYLQNHTKPSIAAWIPSLLSAFKEKGEALTLPEKEEGKPLPLTQAHFDLIESLAASIELSILKAGGGLTGGDSKTILISVEQQDPYVSAMLAEQVVANLKAYIVEYYTSKEKEDLLFIEERCKEAKLRYIDTQNALAEYDDSNINVILKSANTQRTALETENTLAANLYHSLAQKLEQAQILVQDKTPAFTVIEPAKVPLHKSSPRTLFTLISLSLIGLFMGTCVIFFKTFIRPLYTK